MTIYVYTGKLGSGKTLCAVGRIQGFLNRNMIVGTNLDLNLHKLVNPQAKKCRVHRIPDLPSLEDLESLPFGGDKDFPKDEEKHGLLVFDECAHFLNTRGFQAKGRAALVLWFSNARKYGWHVIFIIQHLNALDKQFRDMFAEHIVYCNRMDRLKWPFFIRWPLQILGFSGNLPKIHRALVMYGSGPNAVKADSYVYQGKSLYEAYDTQQTFSDTYSRGVYMYIPPYFTHGKYINDWNHFKENLHQRLTCSSFKMRPFFLAGLLCGVVGTAVSSNDTFVKPANSKVIETKTLEKATKRKELKKEIKAIENKQKSLIYIAGSMMGPNPVIFFQKEGRPFNPRNFGYTFRVLNECHVKLYKKDEKTDIYCGQYNDPAKASTSEDAFKTKIARLEESIENL